MEQKMNIEIWSDVICPFCYIGKRKFEAALAEFPDSESIGVIWKSFQLMPDIPEHYNESIYRLFSERHHASPEQSKKIHDQMEQTSKEIGLEYNFEKVKPANTLKAHQLLHFAKAQGKQDAAEEVLFRSYFTDGKNINDLDTLLELGASVGLDQSALKAALENEAYLSDVHADIAEAQQIGVRGVPFFVFDRKAAVSGAQDSAIFLQALQQTFAGWKKEHSAGQLDVADGESCTPGEECI